jgi:hypothetical protein
VQLGDPQPSCHGRDAVKPPVDAIQEFNVQTGGFCAEFVYLTCRKESADHKPEHCLDIMLLYYGL